MQLQMPRVYPSRIFSVPPPSGSTHCLGSLERSLRLCVILFRRFSFDFLLPSIFNLQL